MQLKPGHILVPLLALFLMGASLGESPASEIEIIGGSQDGSIVAEFRGFKRNDRGELEVLSLAFRNETEETTFNLYIESEPLYRAVIHFMDQEQLIYDPLAESGLRSGSHREHSGEHSRLEPGEVLELDLRFEDHLGEDTYQDMVKRSTSVRIVMAIGINYYAEDGGFDTHPRLGRISAQMFKRDVPLIELDEDVRE